MSTVINAKTLRRDLARIVEMVRKGARFTVLYRSRPAFDIVPVNDMDVELRSLEEDTLYEAPSVGVSRDGKTSVDHDRVLYGTPRR